MGARGFPPAPGVGTACLGSALKPLPAPPSERGWSAVPGGGDSNNKSEVSPGGGASSFNVPPSSRGGTGYEATSIFSSLDNPEVTALPVVPSSWYSAGGMCPSGDTAVMPLTGSVFKAWGDVGWHPPTEEALMRFEDVVVPFSREEWKILKEWQKELYWEVLKDTYNALLFAGGRPVTKSDVLAWLEQCEHQNFKGTQKSRNGDSSDSSCASNDQLAEMCRKECTEKVGPSAVAHGRSEEVMAQPGSVEGAPEPLPMSDMRQESPMRAESLQHTEYRKHIQELARFAYTPRTVPASEPYECGLRGQRTQLKGLPLIPPQIRTNNESFHCPECGVGFPSSSHLRMHWRVHFHSCTERRKASSSLEPSQPVHPQGSQAGERLHLCAPCGKSFQSYLDFLQHQRSHDEAKAQPCAQCGAVFMFQSDLEIHEESHLEDVLCERAACGRNCICDIALQLHLASQPRKHGKSELQSHEQLPQKARSREEKRYSCELCEEQYKLKVNLETHYWYCHKEWLLKLGLKCSAHSSLLQHKKVQARQEHPKPAPSDGRNGFQTSGPPSLPSCTLCSCSYCGKWFLSKFSLRKHQKRHNHGGAAKGDKKSGFTGGLGGPLLANVTKKLYKCQECGKKFVYKWQLVAHRKGHTQEKQPLPLHHGNLLEHEGDLGRQRQARAKKRARKNGKPGESASVPALAVDQGRRGEEQLCLCEVCGRSFRKTYMPQHQAFHAGLRYKCLLCEKISTFKSGAYYHLRRHWQKGDFAPCPEGKKRDDSRVCLCMIEKIYVVPGPPAAQHAVDGEPRPSEVSPARSLCAELEQSPDSSSCLGTQPHGHSQGKQADQAEQEQSHGWKSELEQYQNSLPRHYTCPDCGKEFAYMPFLRMHRKTHKSKQFFQCAECDKKFISSFYLDIHRKKHMKQSA